MKIAHKLLLGAAVPAGLIWGVGLYSTTIGQRSLQESIERASATRARGVMDEIDRAMHMRIAEWIAYSQTTLVQQTLKQSNRTYERLVDPKRYIQREDRKWRESEGAAPTPLLKSLIGNKLAEDLRIHIGNLRGGRKYPIFGEVIVTNRFGANVAQTNRTSDFRQDDEIWWQRAVRDGIYVSDVAFDASAELFATGICLRIDAPDGTCAGVLKAALNTQEAVEIAQQRAIDHRTNRRDRVGLFTADGRVIHTSFSDAAPLSAGSAYLPTDPAMLAPVMTVERVDQDTQVHLLSAVARSKGYGGFSGLGWLLLIELPAKEEMQPLYNLRASIFVIATAATLFVVIAGGTCALSLSRRIRHLTDTTQELGRGNLAVKVQVEGRDELAQLAESVNRMAANLNVADRTLRLQRDTLTSKNRLLKEEVAQRRKVEQERQQLNEQLIESSRRTGMAEVATGVLHNVGNVLNSINVTAALLMNKLKNSRVGSLVKASRVIEEHRGELAEYLTNDERGKHFPRLMKELASHLSDERESQLEEVRSLVENIEHVKAIVHTQQEYAHQKGTMEPVHLTELVEDALRINDAGLSRHNVEVVCEFEEVRPLVLERHKVLQILVNLISNAKYALSDCTREDKTMTLIVKADERAARIQVRDNGIGISKDHLTNIFGHGFSTKKDGHGFGLHSSALAAQELGGALTAASEGPGRGATFTLTLPIAKELLCTT